MRLHALKVLAICCLILQPVAAQAPVPAALAPRSIVGTVTKIDAEAGAISLRSDQSEAFAVSLLPNTVYQRVAPGETDLRKAVATTLTTISAGDRVLARGVSVGQTVSATLVVVMSQSDLASKQAGERADWDKRGINGIVTAVASDSISASVRGPDGTRPVAIVLSQGSIVRRYAPDSVSFADAKVSKLEEVKVGDQVRARGDRSDDGSRLSAVEIVVGTFKTIAGKVLSIDVANREVRLQDLDTKVPLVVRISADSKVQKIAPQTAQAIATRLRSNAAGNDIQQLLEASPSMSLTELKNGDAVVVSSSVGSTTGRITAIRFITGVEPILTRPGTKEMSIGGWTLDVGNGGQ